MHQAPLPGFKVCRKCGRTRGIEDFYRQEGMKDGYRNNCRACHAAQHRDWYEKNREREIARVAQWQRENAEQVNLVQRRNRARRGDEYKRLEREGHLRRKYGLTQNMFEALVLAQLGRCAICQTSEGMELHVDHDHRTNKVRGLLCGKCNKAIGLLNDDVQLMDSAKRYLQQAERFWNAEAS